MSLFWKELKRRNVIRVGVAYLVAAWLVIQISETIFPLFGFSDNAARTVVVLFAIGFVPGLVFAWAFEITPDGLKRDKDVDLGHSISVGTGKRLDRIIIIVLGVAVSYFAIDKYLLVPARDAAVMEGAGRLESAFSADEIVIAVLPFENSSGDVVDEPFTVGFHEDLSVRLSRIASMRTVPRSVMQHYRNSDLTVQEIAQEIGAVAVLTGRVQRAGGQVEISVQLIDSETGAEVWTENYARSLAANSLFAIQGAITETVAERLSATLLPEERQILGEPPTESAEAYDLYLLGRYHLQQRAPESIEFARDYFDEAVRADPDYLLAYSGLADAYSLLSRYGNLVGNTAFPLAEAAIGRAMALDDSRPEVWASLGLLRRRQQRHEEAEEALLRSLELDPGSFNAWNWYSNTLGQLRRFDEQIEASNRAYELEPMNRVINRNLARSYIWRGDFVRSRQHWERLGQIDKAQSSEPTLSIASTYFYEGGFARSIAELADILVDDPDSVAAMDAMAWAYLMLGDTREARTWFSRGESLDFHNRSAYWAFERDRDFAGAVVYLEDKLAIDGNRADISTLSWLFRASYFDRDIAAARGYFKEILALFNGKIESEPSDYGPRRDILFADFLIRHGEEGSTDRATGMSLLEEIHLNLTHLTDISWGHPNTYASLALSNALLGNDAAALASLEQAIDAGFRDSDFLLIHPAFGDIRELDEFEVMSARIRSLNEEQSALLERLILPEYTPPQSRQPIIVGRDVLQKYSGHYVRVTDDSLREFAYALAHFFVAEDGQFMFRIGQGRSMPLLAVAEDEFFTPTISQVTYQFVADDSGSTTHVLSKGSGLTARFRATDPPPLPVPVERAILSRYEGSYVWNRSPPFASSGGDVDSWVAEIVVDSEGRLWIDYDNQPALEMVPYSPTQFYLLGYDARYEFALETGPQRSELIIQIVNGARTELRRVQ